MLVPFGNIAIAKRLGDPSKSGGGAVRSASMNQSSLYAEVINSNIEGIDKGSKVVVRKYSGDEFTHNDETFLFLNPEDIVAINND